LIHMKKLLSLKNPGDLPFLTQSNLSSWLLAPGSWLLAPGSWLLASGYWLLAPVSWLLSPGSWLLAPGSCNHTLFQRHFRSLVFPIHPLNGPHTQSMSQLCQDFKSPSLTCLLPFIDTN
jgi:hypothetical protein